MFLDIVLPFELRDYQIHALNFLLYYRLSGLFAEARTGKTIVFALFAIYCARFQARTIITMPPILFDEFDSQMRELKGDLPEVVYYRQPKARRHTLAKKWKAEDSFPPMLVMTQDIFRRDYDLISPFYDVLVVDESHRFLQSEETIAFQKLSDFSARPDRRLILSTGTPATSELYGVYPTIALINPDAYRSREHFNALHVIFRKIKVTTRRGREILRPVPDKYFNEEEIWRNLYANAVRVARAEVLSFTEPTVQGFSITLHPKHMKEYKTFMRTRILEFDGRLVSAKQEAKLRSLSSQMIVSPHKYSDNPPPNHVLEAVDQIMDMNAIGPEDKCIIFANFRNSVETLIEHFKKKGVEVVSVYGGNSAKENSRNVKTFQEDDACNVIVINPAAGGVGLRLPMATTLIFAEVPVSYGTFDQAVSRAIIDGKMKPTGVYLLRVIDTTHYDDVAKLLKKSEPIRRVNNDAKTLLHDYKVG